jgi:hypothetical protein
MLPLTIISVVFAILPKDYDSAPRLEPIIL